MGEISYTPSFRNIDHVDGDERVQAEGPNGFNAQFGAIESDLAQLSTVVAAIDTRLDELESAPVTTRRLILPLRFLKTVPGPSWQSTGIAAEVAAGQGADGAMNLRLPDGVLLTSLRMVGGALNVSLAITLSRIPISGGGSPQTLAGATGTIFPFDLTRSISPDVGRVDTGAFAYSIRATVGAGQAGLVTGIITGLQLVVQG